MGINPPNIYKSFIMAACPEFSKGHHRAVVDQFEEAA